MKSYVRVMICAVMLVCALLMSGCYDANVNRVREGSLQSHPNVKIGTAFDNFFSDGNWESFDSTRGEKVVEFNGKGYYDGKKADYKIQFVLDGDTGFHLNAVAIDGQNTNLLMNAVLMQVIMEKTNGESNSLKAEVDRKAEQPVVVKEEPVVMVAGEAPDENINFTGKKVIAKSRMVYVNKDPSSNPKTKITETFAAQCFEHLGESYDGKYYRIYVPDYGGAYIKKEHTILMDKDASIGNITMERDGNLYKYPAPRRVIGTCPNGDSYSLLAFICNEYGQWYHISAPDGSKGFINSDDARAKFTI